MDVIFKRTVSASLDELPIVDGQLIVLRDSDAMYYDMDGRRHPVVSALDGSFVTLDTEQIIPSNKQFTGTVTIVTLKQSTDCMASEGSVALGEETTALGQASVSSGHQTSASGDYSTASGNATTASGKGSHAEGAMTVAERNYSTVVGTGNDPQSEDIFEVGNGHVTNDDGEVLPEDQQTFSNAFRVTADGTAIAQKDFQLSDGTKLSGKESSSNKVTSIGSSPTDIQYPSAKAVKTYVDALPQPMIFKGSLGTGGTITALPSASADNEGYTYKVITPGIYSGQQADEGGTFISDGKSWVLIPSGDEPSGTVTNVAAKGSNGIEVTGGPISTSGTLNISGKDVTDSSSGMMTPTMKKKLDTITESASAVTSSTKNGYVSIDGKDVQVYEHPGSGTNPHGTTKSDVGLGNVDNTKDIDKPISTQQQEKFDELSSNLDALEYSDVAGGKNLFDGEFTNTVIGIGGNYTQKNLKEEFESINNVNGIMYTTFGGYFKKGTYTFSYTNGAWFSLNRVAIAGTNCEPATISVRNSYTWTQNVDGFTYFGIEGDNSETGTVDTPFSTTPDIMIEKGSTATTPYEPYIPSVKMLAEENEQQNTEAMDLKMLGWSVPRECPIQNYVDSDCVFHQRVGRVDLGSLNWRYSTSTARFYCKKTM